MTDALAGKYCLWGSCAQQPRMLDPIQMALEVILSFVDVIRGCKARLLQNARILYRGSMLVIYWP